MSIRAKKLAWASAFATWLALTVGVLGLLTSYSSKAGAAATEALTTFPAASTLPRREGRTTLVMIAHTKCACTRASLRELERTLARSGGNVDTFVLFVGPPSSGLLDLRATARAIPGVQVVEDEEEARRFGALTSGQTYLFDGRGRLVFRGGLTPSRGHEGASVGGDAIRRFLDSPHDSPAASSASAQASDVFGCALFAPP